MEWIGLISAVLLGGLFSMHMAKGTRTQDKKHREILRSARQQFLNLTLASENERFAFSGATATIVDLEEKGIAYEEHLETAWLVIYCRNPHGEYFHFISNAERGPYIKHVPQNVAKIVLKEKYVPLEGQVEKVPT